MASNWRSRSEGFRSRYGISPGRARVFGRRWGVGPAEAARRLGSTKEGLRDAPPEVLVKRAEAAEALRGVRTGEFANLAEAERAHGLPRGAISRQFPSAVERRGGRILARRSDREAVPVVVIAQGQGDRFVLTRGSGARSFNSAHRRAVQRFLQTGDESALAPFVDKRVGGARLETDPMVLVILFEKGGILGGPYPESVSRAAA